MIYVEIVPETLDIEEGQIRVAIIRNITERVENEKQIEFMAYYDELTDLPNRNYFQKVLNDEIRASDIGQKNIAVHFLDLDDFKHINDTLGYQFGDQLLISFASRLKQLLFEDIFIARMTGDEFLILQRNINQEEDATQFAENYYKFLNSHWM